VTLKLWY